MKSKTNCILLLLYLPIFIWANTSFFATNKYHISARFVGGYIAPLSKNLQNVIDKPTLGAEISIEFPSLSKYSWYTYWNKPTIGAAVAYYNLGNNKILGNTVALYPYILVPIVNTNAFRFDYKVGGGLSFFDKTWNRCDTLSGVNAETANSAIGSVVNAYLTTGFGMTFNVSSDIALKASIDYIHMSNGSFLQPNAGINMLTASIGVAYVHGSCENCGRSANSYIEPFPYLWSVNMSLSGGARELYYKDHQLYPIASFHAGATYQLSPFYALGGGVDVFYDGVFVRQGSTPDMSDALRAKQKEHTHFNRYLIMEDAAKNKFRMGVCLSNEFVIGRITAMLDWGVYLYDPVKRNSKMFYKYNIEKEDGWNYFRLGLKCRIWDNLYLQTSLKTHLQKAEFIEFGIGYQIPLVKRGNDYSSLSSGGWSIFHHSSTNKRPKPLFSR